MWVPEKLGWRAAVFAIGCAGLIVYAGGARAQSAPVPIVLAQGADGSAAADVPADSPKPLPPDAPEAANDAAAAASPGWFGWGLPPLRWGGATTTDLRMDRSADQPRRLQQTEIGNIRAASYIWQPWFAQVSGGLGLVTSRERGGGSAGLGANQPQQARSSAVTGNGDATLFPVSRFPFNAYFDVSDSRASGELTASDSTSTRFGMRQAYRPLEGNANYSASFNRSTLESSSFGRDTVNALAASMNRNFGPQSFDLSGSHTRNTRSNTGEGTAFSNLFARHSYRPEETDLSVESLASASSSNFRLLSAGVPSSNRSRFAQANTFVTWRPEEDSPLYLSGGARIFQSAITNNNAAESESITMSGNLAATYAFSSQTRASGSATATQLLTDTASTLLTTQAANVSHTGNPVGIFGFAYNWNAAANLANQTGAAEGGRQNLGGQVGHNLTRNLTLGENSQVNFGLGQNVGTTFDTVTASAQTLSHNANASWRLSRGAATSAYVSVLGADSRSRGPNASQFQMINFQASGQLQFSRSSTAAANLTLQGVRQSTSTTPDAGFNFNSSGNLSYFHARAFNVPRLRYSALYNINESQFRTRLQGDVNAPRERVNQSFEQRLDYNVGRIAMQLSMRIAEIEGRRNSMLFFRLGRAFGNF